MTKLSPALPKDNGLDAILDELLQDPLARRVLIAVVDCPTITEDTETGDRDAKVRIRRAVEHRTGTEGLPIDWLDPARPQDPVKVDCAGVVVVPSDAGPSLSLVPDVDPDDEWDAAAPAVDDDEPLGIVYEDGDGGGDDA
jgi:hypothetical protein